MIHHMRGHLTLCSVALLLLAAYSMVATSVSQAGLVQDLSVKEMRTNFKIFLTKMKIRQVPLAKKRGENLLAKLYREERSIKEHKAELENNLQTVKDKSVLQGMKVLDVRRPNDRAHRGHGHDAKGGLHQSLMKVSELTEGRVEEWREELKLVEREFGEIRAKIEQTKRIIKDPESFIAVPTNYGHEDPEEVQEREREILTRDRLNMNYRMNVEEKVKPAPLWLSDVW